MVPYSTHLFLLSKVPKQQTESTVCSLLWFMQTLTCQFKCVESMRGATSSLYLHVSAFKIMTLSEQVSQCVNARLKTATVLVAIFFFLPMQPLKYIYGSIYASA